MNDINVNERLDGIGEILSYGSQMLLIGLAAVFAVLIIILLFIKLLQFFLGGHSADKTATKAIAPTQVEAKAVQNTALDEEIVAVIAAAIACAEAESGGIKFRVVSFRKR